MPRLTGTITIEAEIDGSLTARQLREIMNGLDDATNDELHWRLAEADVEILDMGGAMVEDLEVTE